MDIESHPIPILLHIVQPIACHVLFFSQYLEGKAPDFSEMQFLADAAVIPHPENKKVVSIALIIEGYRLVSETDGKRFFRISTTTDFVLLGEKRKRVDFPSLLDIDIPPFNTAISLAISLTRGHLLTRFQGSLWPNFILPSIGVQEFRQALKQRDASTYHEPKPLKEDEGLGSIDQIADPADE
jgi:hypothetical protein